MILLIKTKTQQIWPIFHCGLSFKKIDLVLLPACVEGVCKYIYFIANLQNAKLCSETFNFNISVIQQFFLPSCLLFPWDTYNVFYNFLEFVMFMNINILSPELYTVSTLDIIFRKNIFASSLFYQMIKWFDLVWWHNNPCGLFHAKSCLYIICEGIVWDNIMFKQARAHLFEHS